MKHPPKSDYIGDFWCNYYETTLILFGKNITRLVGQYKSSSTQLTLY